MTSGVRRLVLSAHLTVSIGWTGAVAAYLTLDVTVATSQDAEVVRAAWIAMGAITSRAIVPLAVCSLLTGIVMALGTRWGLFRHWWVLISLTLTVFATVVLLSESGSIGRAAAVAAEPATPEHALRGLSSTLPHSIGGIAVLLIIQALNIYKPQGLTRYGWRKQQEAQRALLPNFRRNE